MVGGIESIIEKNIDQMIENNIFFRLIVNSKIIIYYMKR